MSSKTEPQETADALPLIREVAGIAASGVSLLLLFPLGLISTGIPFVLFFLIHLIIHIYTVGTAFQLIVNFFLGKKENTKKISSLLTFTAGVLFPLILLGLLSAAPVITRDPLIHHLAIPKMWLQVGKISEIPWHEWSYYPMLLQLAYTGLLALGLDQLVTIYHASFLIFLAALIIHFGRKYFSPETTKLGVLLTFATPLFFRLASSPYVDLPLVVYGLGGLLLLQTLITTDKGEGKTVAILIGALIGLSAGTKYNGLLFGAVFFGAYSIVAIRSKQVRSTLVLSLITAAIIGSPWYLKNFLITENPVYPLLGGLFPSQSEVLVQLPPFAVGSSSKPELFEILLFPINMILYGRDDTPSGFDGVLSPLYLFLFLAPFVKKNRWSSIGALLLLLTYTYLALDLSGLRTRYLAPVLGIALVLTLTTLDRLSELFSENSRGLFFGALFLLQITLGGYYGVELIQKREIIPVLLGEVTEERYRNEKVTESRLSDVVNEKLPKEAKVYLLHTGNRYFLYDRAVFNSGYFSDRHILTWIKDPKTSLKDAFKKKGITHIAFHKDRYRRAFTQYQKEGFLSDSEAKRWDHFAKNDFLLLYEREPFLIGEIK